MTHPTIPSWRRITPLAALAIAASVTLGGTCVPPANEECDGAIAFGSGDLPFDFSDVLGCANDMVDRPYFDVFFEFVCNESGEYVFEMCGSTGDSYMRIYVDGCGFGPASSWVEDDDGCRGSPNSLDPKIEITMEAGRRYWIELGAWRVDEVFPPNANDPYTFHADLSQPPCPSDCGVPPDASVDVTDLLELLGQWSTGGSCDGDGGGVGVTDLLALLAAWGPCGG